jgi:hypothetical protein
MEVLLHEFSTLVVDRGVPYRVQAWGEPREDGQWEGWLLFLPEVGVSLMTGRETTQNSLNALVYWATGLEPTYLEGAFARANPADGIVAA